jgi:hypothetical protein
MTWLFATSSRSIAAVEPSKSYLERCSVDAFGDADAIRSTLAAGDAERVAATRVDMFSRPTAAFPAARSSRAKVSPTVAALERVGVADVRADRGSATSFSMGSARAPANASDRASSLDANEWKTAGSDRDEEAGVGDV